MCLFVLGIFCISLRVLLSLTNKVRGGESGCSYSWVSSTSSRPEREALNNFRSLGWWVFCLLSPKHSVFAHCHWEWMLYRSGPISLKHSVTFLGLLSCRNVLLSIPSSEVLYWNNILFRKLTMSCPESVMNAVCYAGNSYYLWPLKGVYVRALLSGGERSPNIIKW